MQILRCCKPQSNFSVRKALIIIANISLLTAFLCIVFFSKDSFNMNGSQDGAVKIHFFNSALQQSTPQAPETPLNHTTTITENSTKTSEENHPSSIDNSINNDTNQTSDQPQSPDAKNQSNQNDQPDTPKYAKSIEEVYSDPFIKETIIDREGTSAFQLNGGKVEVRDPRKIVLCKLKRHGKYCQSQYIAEELDRMWAFAPIYSSDQRKTYLLYKHHKNFVYYMKSFGIKTVVVEAIYPGQNYVMTTAGKEPFECCNSQD